VYQSAKETHWPSRPLKDAVLQLRRLGQHPSVWESFMGQIGQIKDMLIEKRSMRRQRAEDVRFVVNAYNQVCSRQLWEQEHN
jgi:hypothetical protein